MKIFITERKPHLDSPSSPRAASKDCLGLTT